MFVINNKFYRKPTIQEIKKRNDLYFSRDTMKFFGQKMNMFKVEMIKNRVFIYAPMFCEGRLAGYSFREFLKSGKLKITSVPHNTLTDIYNYFDSIKGE